MLLIGVCVPGVQMDGSPSLNHWYSEDSLLFDCASLESEVAMIASEVKKGAVTDHLLPPNWAEVA